ncbi:conjugative transposon protein TraM [Chryseobacterium glaciei]|uniref:Conjugative transposon protein TraM n=1 Tax=Chryseobacterium glaciei TaxID=1685010 RepID=A0A172Y129_9FLAO|nr:conjugative transposon protein TraM [Chryseobacterium glaciei]ANF52987.1 conjugative transposon protein TraM [Chryseobacterium glaciei]
MKDNEKDKATVRLTEVSQKGNADTEVGQGNNIQKLKKPLIFILMGIVFLGCMCLIFRPSSDGKELEQAGLNEAVPQATETGMQADKSKAYEADLLDQKELEKKQSLNALSEYWNTDSAASSSEMTNSGTHNGGSVPTHEDKALNSYRNIQGTLGNFYEDKGPTTQLQSEVRALKAQLAQKEEAPSNPVESQLALMEKSYQMAAKYFPTTGNVPKIEGAPEKGTDKMDSAKPVKQKVSLAALYPAKSNIVSALYREPTDSAWIAELSQAKNRNFYTAGTVAQAPQAINSIRACVHETQSITAEQAVRIRLLDAIILSKLAIPKGTVLTAIAKFQGTRLQLLIQSIEFKGNIIPVELTAYDLDGQPGLAVPYSPERSALTEMAANMGNTGGTSISLSSTAGQQITSDLSKSVVQGISGYFSKKIRMPKITLKAGYQVFLVSKK